MRVATVRAPRALESTTALNGAPFRGAPAGTQKEFDLEWLALNESPFCGARASRWGWSTARHRR